MTTTASEDYALDLLSPVRHVATKLERARPSGRAVPLAELFDYTAQSGDLSRIKQHEGCRSDRAATRWLIERAIRELDGRIAQDADGYRLTGPLDDMRYQRRKIRPFVDEHERLRDPFNPQSGIWSDNIGGRRLGDLTELVESMRNFGWLTDLGYAIRDERKVLLVGHRRVAAAEEAGIEPRIKTITFGDGDQPDAERVKLALASNLGMRPLAKEQRAKVAQYLYGEREWSQQRIAAALDVSQSTIRDDLRELVVGTNPDRPKRGRPRTKLTSREVNEVVHRYFAQGQSRDDIVADLGLGKTAVGNVINQEKMLRQGREERREDSGPENGSGEGVGVNPPATVADDPAPEDKPPLCSCCGGTGYEVRPA